MARRQDVIKPERNWKGLSIHERCLTPADLPEWAKLGIVRQGMSGRTFKAIAEEFEQPPAYLHAYAGSPGGKAFRAIVAERVAELNDNPVEKARYGASMEGPYWVLEMRLLYEAARKAGDINEMGRIARHMLKVTGVERPEDKNAAPAVIIINQQPGTTLSVEKLMGESTHERVIDAEIIGD